MKIVVVNVAAEEGGAMSVLNAFIAAAGRAQGIEWLFLLGRTPHQSTKNLEIKKYPWAKRSWLHRIWFDIFVAPRIIIQANPNVVFSLQNVPVARIPQTQIVYLHQALPFSRYSFNLLTHPRLWVYQQVTRVRIGFMAKRADWIVVQTKWMRRAVLKKYKLSEDRVTVINTTLDEASSLPTFEASSENYEHFFFPSAPLPYKNHKVIIEAVKILNETSGKPFEVTLTITPKDFRKLGLIEAPSNVRLVGPISYESVQSAYGRSVLIFPSELETVGLPLLEAARAQTYIIAADLPYAHESLRGYSNALYFDPRDPVALSAIMLQVMNGTVSHTKDRHAVNKAEDSMEALVKFVVNTTLSSVRLP